MADIFLSYAREDQATARRYADALAHEGFTVWWDQSLNAGENFDKVTEQALKEARAVVVLWSKHSVESRWVRSEATLADRYGTLVPVMIEPCDRPIMFELTHTADLSGWNGQAVDVRWRNFVDGLRRPAGAATGTSALAARGNHASEPRAQRAMWIAWVVAALALVVAGLMLWLQHGGAGKSPAQAAGNVPVQPLAGEFFHAPQGDQRRLAVLPFTNLSADPGDALFADGLHEELLNALSQTAPDLQLISRTTMMTYRQNPKPVSIIAAELGATHVLESSLRRDPQQVRLTVQLIDARTDEHVWSENFDRTGKASLGLQTEVARAVAAQLVRRLAGPHEGVIATQDPEAWEQYLKATALMGSTFILSLDLYAEIMSSLDKAIERDPTFTQAYLQRVRARMIIFDQGLDQSRKLVEAARADLDTARKLAPEEGQVHAVEALYIVEVQKDFQLALQEIDVARAAGNFNPALDLIRATALVSLGQKAEALSTCRQLVGLDPANVASLTLCAARADEAVDLHELVRYVDLLQARAPNAFMARARRPLLEVGYAGRTDAISAQIAGGLVDEARKFYPGADTFFFMTAGRYREVLDLPPPAATDDAPRIAWLSARVKAALLLDQHASASQDGRQLLSLLGGQMNVPWTEADRQQQTAVAYLGTGQCDKALGAARRAVELLPHATAGTWWVSAASTYAQTAAWCGKPDTAMDLLETLATGVPGLAPGTIANDPIYNKKLTANPRFQALKARLELQMQQNARDLGLPER
jgi:TolB-like protein